jgi:cell division protein FtsW
MTHWIRKLNFRPTALSEDTRPFDSLLLVALFALACIGIVMVGSASVAIAEKRFGNEMRYALQQFVFMSGSLVIAWAVFQKTTLDWWREQRGTLLLIAVLLVLMTIVLGREINGAKRWLSLGFINLQPSEFLKLVMIVFMAAYLEKNFKQHKDEQGNRDWVLEKKNYMRAVWLLALPLVPIFSMLLLQPDFGSLMVVLSLVFFMLLIAGAPLRLIAWLLPLGAIVILVIVIEPYRMARVTSFLDPWGDPQRTGYQLTHSLMALGRGEWFGVGLGNSVEKLFYLPDAHTDFLFAIYGEEFGFMGVVALISLYVFVIWRIFLIGVTASLRHRVFSAMICYGIGIWIAIQVMINMGANLGLLPTKGLTLPLVSYGGSSLLTIMVGLALVFRVDWDNRHAPVVVEVIETAPPEPDEVTEAPSPLPDHITHSAPLAMVEPSAFPAHEAPSAKHDKHEAH